MPKSQAKSSPDSENQPGQEEKKKRGGSSKTAKSHSRKEKPKKPLLARVQKVIRKSRRKLSEEKFEKELQRTIAFLGGIQAKIGEAPVSEKSGKGNRKKTGPKKRKHDQASSPPLLDDGSRRTEEG
ncbi:MAG: hypothetical protein ACOYNR_05410 [Blastocatellia bacterium]